MPPAPSNTIQNLSSAQKHAPETDYISSAIQYGILHTHSLSKTRLTKGMGRGGGGSGVSKWGRRERRGKGDMEHRNIGKADSRRPIGLQ